MRHRPASVLRLTRAMPALSVSAAALAIAMMGGAASAQTTTPPATQAPAKTPAAQAPAQATQAPAQAGQTPAAANGTGNDTGDTTSVTITAATPPIQHKIDRDVYDVKQDPTSATGSGADVLNNVPAVTVDPDGTVALRGNTNVQVYVNGKKSAMMQGDSRGFTLQSLSGDDIDSVEVITNPSAEFGSDSSGGIINIVMKRGRAIKPQTSVNVVVGDQGRANVGFATGKTIGKLTLNSRISVSHGAGGDGGGRGNRGGGFGPKSKSFDDRIRLDPTTGAVLGEDKTTSVSKRDNSNVSGNLNGRYQISDSDTLEGNFDYQRRNSTGVSSSEVLSYNGAGTLTGDRGSVRNSFNDSEGMTFNLIYDHMGQIGSTEDFKMQLSHSQNIRDSGSDIYNIFHQAVPTETYSAQYDKTKDFVDEFSGDWVHPFGTSSDTWQQQLKTGWDVQHQVSDQFTYRSLTQATPVQSPENPRASAVNQFNVEQTLTAGYFIYEGKVDKIGYQGGLRIENMHQEMRSLTPLLGTAAINGTYDNLFYSPNFILSYDLAAKDQLKFSYSQKLRRPATNEVNPQVVLSDDGLTARSGNANLKPEKTDKYEVSYTHSSRGTDVKASLHYDSTSNSINQVTTFLTGSNDVLLYTYDNSGSRKQSGVDFTVSGQSTDRKISYNLNSTFNYVTTDATDLTTHQPIHYAGPVSSVGGRVSYKVTPKDTFTFFGQYQGKRTGFQTYSTPVTRLNLSYAHQIIPNKMILTVNASGFLVGPTSKTYRNTSTVDDVNYTFNPGASFMASLRYTFGQVRSGDRNGQGQWQRGQGGWGGPVGQGGPGGGGGPGGPGGGV